MRHLLFVFLALMVSGCIDDGRGSPFGSSPRPVTQASREDPPLRIVQARYGTDRRSCDATRAVRRACEGESDCSLKAGNELCGDPTPGQVKTLYVSYRCRGRVRDITRQEGKYLSLDCD